MLKKKALILLTIILITLNANAADKVYLNNRTDLVCDPPNEASKTISFRSCKKAIMMDKTSNLKVYDENINVEEKKLVELKPCGYLNQPGIVVTWDPLKSSPSQCSNSTAGWCISSPTIRLPYCMNPSSQYTPGDSDERNPKTYTVVLIRPDNNFYMQEGEPNNLESSDWVDYPNHANRDALLYEDDAMYRQYKKMHYLDLHNTHHTFNTYLNEDIFNTILPYELYDLSNIPKDAWGVPWEHNSLSEIKYRIKGFDLFKTINSFKLWIKNDTSKTITITSRQYPSDSELFPHISNLYKEGPLDNTDALTIEPGQTKLVEGISNFFPHYENYTVDDQRHSETWTHLKMKDNEGTGYEVTVVKNGSRAYSSTNNEVYLLLGAVYIKDQASTTYSGNLSEYVGYPSVFNYHYTLNARYVSFPKEDDADFYFDMIQNVLLTIKDKN